VAKKIEVQIVGDASSLQRALGTATDGTSRFGSALGTLAKTGALAAGAAGIGAVAVTLRQGIKEYTESAKVAAQTNAVIESTGQIANVTAKDVDKLAESLMRKSGVDDEVIKAGENMLLTFTKVRNEVGKGNDIFNQATVAATNVSVALGKDLPDAAMLVGKALNDPIKGMTAMTRAGIQFTDAQKEQIKAMVESGDVMGAQKVILEELETQFGGSAEAIGKTLPGQLAVLKESFNNFAGSLIAGVAPKLQEFVTFLNTKLIPAEGFTAKLKVVWEGVSEVAVDLWGQLEAAIMGETKTLQIPTEKRIEFVEVEGLGSKLKEQIKASIAAIDWSDVLLTVGIAIGKGVLQLQMHIWQFLFSAWKAAWSLLLGAARDAAVGLAGVVVSGVSNLPGLFGAAIRTAMTAGVQAIKDAFGAAFSAAKALGGRIVDGVMDVVGGLVGKVRGVVNAVVSAVNGVIGRINSALEFSTPGLTIAGRTIVPSASFDAPDIPYVGGMAAGGPVRGRTPYMVGERGPELFVPGRSGSIVPNHALAAGGVTVNIYAPIGSERDLENMVVSALTNVRNRGGLS
jgi:hypothetical protein